MCGHWLTSLPIRLPQSVVTFATHCRQMDGERDRGKWRPLKLQPLLPNPLPQFHRVDSVCHTRGIWGEATPSVVGTTPCAAIGTRSVPATDYSALFAVVGKAGQVPAPSCLSFVMRRCSGGM